MAFMGMCATLCDTDELNKDARSSSADLELVVDDELRHQLHLCECQQGARDASTMTHEAKGVDEGRQRRDDEAVPCIDSRPPLQESLSQGQKTRERTASVCLVDQRVDRVARQQRYSNVGHVAEREFVVSIGPD